MAIGASSKVDLNALERRRVVQMSKNKKAPENKAGDRKAKVKKILKQIASQLHVIVAQGNPNY
jgi:hypothetical protein